MPAGTNTSLRKAVDDLSQVLNSSLGANQDCMQAIANIEEMLNSIENKLNEQPAEGRDNMNSGEALSFAPEPVASKI
jgi:hypothetical protein